MKKRRIPVVETLEGYKCRECHHRCTSYNGGRTYGVDGDRVNGGCIWLKAGEYAPCGRKLGKVTTT